MIGLTRSMAPNNHRPSRAFIALLVPVVVVLTQASAAELLYNPSFDDLNGNGSYGDGWASYGTTGFHDYFGGDPHASFFSDQAANAGGVYQMGIPAYAGTVYTLELSNVRIEHNADADFVFGLEFYEDDDATLIDETFSVMPLTTSGDGLSFTMTATAPSSAAFVRPVVKFGNVRSTASQQENVFVFNASLTSEEAPDADQVNIWLTRGDQVSLLEQRPPLTMVDGSGSHSLQITVDPGQTYQTIDGFGASITDSSAWLIQNELTTAQRATLLQKLFSQNAGIGISMVRIPMGSSDFALTPYTYDDMPSGQTDPTMANFSIAHDQDYIIPTLISAKAINNEMKLVASPWSPPAWMKNTQTLWGGSLKTDHMGAYADYFVNFVQDYENAGLPIYAVTPQNEPLNGTTAMPAATMPTYQQSAFIGSHLGPAFVAANIDTKILAFDHNWSDWSYPVVVLNDPLAAQYTSGAAFHGYEGSPSQQSNFHNYHPEAEIHFTEMSGGEWSTDFATNLTWGVGEIVIGTTRNWSRSTIFWNMALDQNHGPRIGGCENCRGVVTINTYTGNVNYEVEYYIIGHASKCVRPGATRIDSTTVSDTLETVAFRNPDGTIAMIALNPQGGSQWFDVLINGRSFSYRLPGQSVATFLWQSIIPGDFDGNGQVNFDDVDDGTQGNDNSLFDYLGQPAPIAEHDLDANGDSAGVIDVRDLLVLVEDLLSSAIGDLDRDLSVSLSDYAILVDGMGDSGGYFDGDLNGDGTVDLADFAIFQIAFN